MRKTYFEFEELSLFTGEFCTPIYMYVDNEWIFYSVKGTKWPEQLNYIFFIILLDFYDHVIPHFIRFHEKTEPACSGPNLTCPFISLEHQATHNEGSTNIRDKLADEHHIAGTVQINLNVSKFILSSNNLTFITINNTAPSVGVDPTITATGKYEKLKNATKLAHSSDSSSLIESSTQKQLNTNIEQVMASTYDYQELTSTINSHHSNDSFTIIEIPIQESLNMANDEEKENSIKSSVTTAAALGFSSLFLLSIFYGSNQQNNSNETTMNLNVTPSTNNTYQ